MKEAKSYEDILKFFKISQNLKNIIINNYIEYIIIR